MRPAFGRVHRPQFGGPYGARAGVRWLYYRGDPMGTHLFPHNRMTRPSFGGDTTP